MPDHEQNYDLIHINCFHLLKHTFEGILTDTCSELSFKLSKWVRKLSEESIRNGKKILFFRDN